MIMNRLRWRVWLAALVVAGAVACESEPPVPTRPTWVNDVEPILRGNCFQKRPYSRGLSVYWDLAHWNQCGVCPEVRIRQN